MIDLQRRADQEHVEPDAELRADIEDVLGLLGEQRPLEAGEEQPEQRRPEHHAGDHLTDHLRLAEELLADPADHSAREQDHRELEEEMDAEVARRIALGGALRGRTVRAENVVHRLDETAQNVGRHRLFPNLSFGARYAASAGEGA